MMTGGSLLDSQNFGKTLPKHALMRSLLTNISKNEEQNNKKISSKSTAIYNQSIGKNQSTTIFRREPSKPFVKENNSFMNLPAVPSAKSLQCTDKIKRQSIYYQVKERQSSPEHCRRRPLPIVEERNNLYCDDTDEIKQRVDKSVQTCHRQICCRHKLHTITDLDMYPRKEEMGMGKNSVGFIKNSVKKFERCGNFSNLMQSIRERVGSRAEQNDKNSPHNSDWNEDNGTSQIRKVKFPRETSNAMEMLLDKVKQNSRNRQLEKDTWREVPTTEASSNNNQWLQKTTPQTF